MHPQVKALLDDLIASGRPSSRTLPLPDGRRNFDELFSSLSDSDPSIRARDLAVPGPAGDIPLRVYEPNGRPPFPVAVFLHGGGWVFGGTAAYDGTCRLLASKSGVAVAFADYRLAPEYHFPAAVDDATAVLDWIHEYGDTVGLDAGRVALAGDSSGGTIAIAAAIRARDRGGSPIRLLALVYPALDPTLSSGSYREFADDDFLSRGEMEWYWAQYLGPNGDTADPSAAPVHLTNLSGLPPTLLILAERDVLRDEGEAFGERLRAAGVAVTLRRYGDMPHGFLVMTRYLDGAREALRDAADALAAALAAPGAGST